LEFVFQKNVSAERQRFLRELRSFAREHALTSDMLHAADLVLEEHFSNILTYGYDKAQDVEIVVRLSWDGSELLIEVRDGGRPFDPTAQPGPDFNLPAEQRPIGGLGIHIMRQYMDGLEYRREEGKNVLVMRKRPRRQPAPGERSGGSLG